MDTYRLEAEANPYARTEQMRRPEREDSAKSGVAQFLQIIWRRKGLVAAFLVAGLIIAVAVAMVRTPIYTATSTLEISRQEDRIVQVDGLQPEVSSIDQEFYQTQYSLLESEALMQRVSKQLDLVNDTAFLEAFGIEAESDLFGAQDDERARVESLERQVLEALDLNSSITPIRGSRIVNVNFSSPNPDLSARVANAWVEAFIASNFDRKLQSTTTATNFLQEQLGEFRQRLERSERDLVAYATANRIITLNSNVGDEESGQGGATIADANLASLNMAYARARAERIAAESRLRAGSSATQVNIQALNDLRSKRAELAAEYAKILNTFTPEYPRAQDLRTQIAEIDSAIAAEERRSRDMLQRAFSSARTEEERLEAAVDNLKEQNLAERRKGIQYNIYQREVDTNRELYDGLLQRFKEIGLAAGIGPNNIAVVDAARPPQEPTSPNLMNHLLVGLLLSLMGAAACVALIEQLDQTVRNPDEIQSLTEHPLLGTIPAIDDPSLDHWQDTKSIMFESYMSVQTALRLATDTGVPKSIMFTSTGPGEGKSMSCLSLARVLLASGRTVIVLDGDLRRPSIHQKLGIANKEGMSEYLASQANWQDLVHHTQLAGIDVITAGTIPPNPSELLSSDRLGDLLQVLGTHYDHVLIDSPPLLGLADAPLIAEKTAASLFVIQANRAKMDDIRKSIARLDRNARRIVGVLLTQYKPEGRLIGYENYAYEYGYGSNQSSAKT